MNGPRYYVVHTDVPEVGAFIAAEVVAGCVADALGAEWELVPERHVRPELLQAWRRRDDDRAAQSREFLEVCFDIEERLTGSGA